MGKRTIEIPDILHFYQNSEEIPNIASLERVGAGHDGIVFRYGDKALKVLKYDIRTRREKGLMTFEKAVYFQNHLQLKRILKPDGVLLDKEGVYSGYRMPYKEKTDKSLAEFTCQDFITFSEELREDFTKLAQKRVIAGDINEGSYIVTDDFLYLCDTDKYQIVSEQSNLNVTSQNQKSCHFAVSKFLYYEMMKLVPSDNINKKKFAYWIKKSSNDSTFLTRTYQEIGQGLDEPLQEYISYKVKQIIPKR